MVPDALRIYIQENITNGFDREALSASLISGGWSEADVASAFAEYDTPAATPTLPSSVVFTPEASAVPVEPIPAMLSSSILPQKVVAPVPEVSPMASVENPAPVMQLEVTPVIETQTPPHPSPRFFTQEAEASPKRKIAIIIAIVMGVVVLGGGASAYMLLSKNNEPSPEAIILKMQTAMKEIHSSQTVMNMNVKLTATQYPSSNSPASLQNASAGKLDMRLMATGSAIIGPTATSTDLDLVYALSGNAGYGAFSMDLDMALQARLVKGVAYVKAVKLPQIISMFAPGSSAFTDKWISIDPTASSTLASIQGAGINTRSGVLTPSDEERKRAQEMLVRDWPLVISNVTDKTAPMLDGQSMYHFHYTVDQVKLRALLADSIDLRSGAQQLSDEEKQYSKDMSGQMAAFFASSSGELYNGKSDSYIHRATWISPVDIATSSLHVIGNIDFDIFMSKFNSVAPILAPTDAQPLQHVLDDIQHQALQTVENGGDAGMVGSLVVARGKSRDAKRISDLGQLMLAEELYFDAHQKYSVTLEPLYKENFIPAIPTDPGTGDQKPKAYLYKQTLKGKSYTFEPSLDNVATAVTLDSGAYSQVVKGLYSYYAKHNNTFPATLADLSKEHFIIATPVHTSGAYNQKNEVQYTYQQLNKGKTYQLGASLESADNAVLETDADGNVNGKATNFGADALGCKGEAGRHCYDVTP